MYSDEVWKVADQLAKAIGYISIWAPPIEKRMEFVRLAIKQINNKEDNNA